MRKTDSGGLVYSTETGRMCPSCRKPVAACICRKPSQTGATQGPDTGTKATTKDGKPRINLETKGRGGKAVTVIRGVNRDADGLIALGKQLRTACGTGGTVKAGVIELQGDHCDKVRALLSSLN